MYMIKYKGYDSVWVLISCIILLSDVVGRIFSFGGITVAQRFTRVPNLHDVLRAVYQHNRVNIL